MQIRISSFIKKPPVILTWTYGLSTSTLVSLQFKKTQSSIDSPTLELRII